MHIFNEVGNQVRSFSKKRNLNKLSKICVHKGFQTLVTQIKEEHAIKIPQPEDRQPIKKKNINPAREHLRKARYSNHNPIRKKHTSLLYGATQFAS